MAKIKVKAVYYVDAADWQEAESAVEQHLITADRIESEPASQAARDFISFGIKKHIYAEHNKIYFENQDNEKIYKQKVEELFNKTSKWVENIIEEALLTNEKSWE